jgi:hypothetical protein
MLQFKFIHYEKSCKRRLYGSFETELCTILQKLADLLINHKNLRTRYLRTDIPKKFAD